MNRSEPNEPVSREPNVTANDEMRRLVVVSNRVADLRRSSQSGGLAVALADAMRERGGLWFGWDGVTGREEPGKPGVQRIGKVTTVAAQLSQQDYSDYYVGYANSVLWPLFHYRLDLVDYRPAFFEGYLKVNAHFAAALERVLRPDDLVWVHDYHLIPLAEYLRRQGCRQRIGFFLHIPFPPPDLLSASPNHKALVEALLGYDVVGFQTSTDLANFKHYVEQHTDAEILADGRIRSGQALVLAGRFPIGIDVVAFRAMALAATEDVQIDMMRREILGRKQVIGVDRLDYSKGLPGRMEAFGQLLARNPKLRKAVTFLQIAPTTRQDVEAYAEIRAELERLSGSINGRFADFNWTPIRYIRRSLSRKTLAGLFRSSQVGFVTPLRDGMNLVAKEYVAAQDDENPGVLVLSQFAGAAEEMQDALIVNPYDIDEMARSLFRALTMPLAERKARHRALYALITRQDAHAWRENFLAALKPTGHCDPQATGAGSAIGASAA